MKKIIGICFILVILGLGAAYLYRNSIVESAIEEATTYALKVDADLGSAALGIWSGKLELNKYKIANPGGFQAENLFVMNHGLLVMNTGSIFDNEIIVDTLTLDGIRLHLEQIDTKNNIKQILDNLKQFDFGSSSAENEKSVKIKYAKVTDIGVDAVVTILGKEQYNKSLTLDNFTMNEIGGKSGTTVAGSIAILLKEILSRASTAGTAQMGLNFDTDAIKDEAKKKIESEVKNQLKDIGGALKGD